MCQPLKNPPATLSKILSRAKRQRLGTERLGRQLPRRSHSIFLWLCALLVAGVTGQDAAAQKGNKTPPPPAADGTIYLARGTTSNTYSMWGMRADGSNLTRVLPGTFSGLSYFLAAVPTEQVYGTDPLQDRWWLTRQVTGYYDEWHLRDGSVLYDVAHQDLFAVRTNPQNRSQVERIQLTDLYGYVRLSPGGSWDSIPYWTLALDGRPDGQVVQPVVWDIRRNFRFDEDGRAIVDASTPETPQPHRQIRLPFGGPEIQAAWLGDGWVPFGPQQLDPEELDLALDLILLPTWIVYGPLPGVESPDGNSYVRHTTKEGYFISDAFAPSVPVFHLDNPGAGNGSDRFPQWSPDGATIMLIDGTSNIAGSTSQGGSVYLQAASGGSATPLVLAGTVKQGKTIYLTRYFNSKWSYDSKYLATRTYKFTGGSKVGEGLVRVSAADGKVVDLKVDTSAHHIPIGWVSNRAAP